jgi:hypothetical protein
MTTPKELADELRNEAEVMDKWSDHCFEEGTALTAKHFEGRAEAFRAIAQMVEERLIDTGKPVQPAESDPSTTTSA